MKFYKIFVKVDRPEEIYPFPVESKPILSDEEIESDDSDLHYYIIYHTSIKQD